jgi:hypothetical protein
MHRGLDEHVVLILTICRRFRTFQAVRHCIEEGH